MSKFQDRIKNTLAKVDPRRSANGSAMTPFDQVLQEFVDTLTAEEPYLGAAVERGQHPQMRSFVTWPRYRRDERSIMLTFFWDGTTMKVLNETARQPFDSPVALGDYLVEFLGESAFPATLAEYAKRCDEDVDGFLRSAALFKASPDDKMVLVHAADQKRLAESPPGTELGLFVEPEPLPSTTENSAWGSYRYLFSGGFGLHLPQPPTFLDGKVHLQGKTMGPDESSTRP